MKYYPSSLALLLHAAHLGNAQAPPNSQPSTQGDLIVTYNGTSAVERDMLLFPDRTSRHTPPNPIQQINQSINQSHQAESRQVRQARY